MAIIKPARNSSSTADNIFASDTMLSSTVGWVISVAFFKVKDSFFVKLSKNLPWAKMLSFSTSTSL